jgi:hypothetical protein
MKFKDPEYIVSEAWCRWLSLFHPEAWERTFHVPNERAEGSQRILLSKIGVKNGVSDYIMLMPRGKYHGFVLEIKKEGATESDVTETQRAFLQQCANDGYYACVGIGLDQAMLRTDTYLKLPKVKPGG